MEEKLGGRVAVLEERCRTLTKDLSDLERDFLAVREKVNLLGTAAAIATAAAHNAGRRERRLYALAGLSLTALNVAVAIVTITGAGGMG